MRLAWCFIPFLAADFLDVDDDLRVDFTAVNVALFGARDFTAAFDFTAAVFLVVFVFIR